MVFPVFLFTTKERLFRSIGKTSRKGPTKCVAKEKLSETTRAGPCFVGFELLIVMNTPNCNKQNSFCI